MSLALGIEIGGTKLQAGIGFRDEGLLALSRRMVDLQRGGEGIRAEIPSLVDEVLRKAGISGSDLSGAGVGFGGPVDSNAGRVLVSHQIEGWSNFPLRDWLREKTGLPVVLQNDAKTAALAEASRGAGRGRRRIFYITVGSGIGGGLVLDGRPDVGQGLGAGEIGHSWVTDPETGKPEKLELVASGWSIGKRGSRRLGRELSGAEVAALASQGDPRARAVVEEAACALASGIGNVLALLHPERFIIGGGVSLMGPLFWEPLRAALATKYAFKPFAETYDVVPAALGEEVVVIGAVQLGLGAG
jgi:glucokinase